MSLVKAKKHLGQHFLTDKNIAAKIVNGLVHTDKYKQVLEVGPGMGILSDLLLERKDIETYLIDIDVESYHFLQQKYPQLGDRLINGDFLALDLSAIFKEKYAIIGNFPYNISSQIVFRIIDEKDKVQTMTGMFQKEVAIRIAAKHGSKDYGVTSVLTQTYYDCHYLFDVPPESFNPPPKVMSGIIQLKRKTEKPVCNEVLFKRVVKAAFNQRRKTMRNSLKEFTGGKNIAGEEIFNLRPEQISVEQFQQLTNLIENG